MTSHSASAPSGALFLLLLVAAAASTGTAATGLLELHRLAKPLTMVVAIIFIATRAYPSASGGRFQPRFKTWLMIALACSLAGDVALMFPGYFVPGLVAFLLAHLSYIAMLKQGQAWFASRRALLAVLSFGACMYAVLWIGGLPPSLRAPVAAYVLVIALMAAQAIGRAVVLRDRAASGVALGAIFFMLSDTLLALNKFVAPLPLAPLWVLSTYYAAQLLIVRHAHPN